ncbi:unnamed protein product [Calypogeia fissa]
MVRPSRPPPRVTHVLTQSESQALAAALALAPGFDPVEDPALAPVEAFAPTQGFDPADDPAPVPRFAPAYNHVFTVVRAKAKSLHRALVSVKILKATSYVMLGVGPQAWAEGYGHQPHTVFFGSIEDGVRKEFVLLQGCIHEYKVQCDDCSVPPKIRGENGLDWSFANDDQLRCVQNACVIKWLWNYEQHAMLGTPPGSRNWIPHSELMKGYRLLRTA